MASRPLLEKNNSCIGGCVSLQYNDNVARVTKNGSGNQQRKPGRKSACTACKASGAVGQGGGSNDPAAPPSTDRRTCLVSAQTCTQTCARQRNYVRGSVSSCSLPLCGRSTKTFPHSWMTCLQIDSLSHWTLHDIVISQCAVPCATTTDVMFHENVFCAVLRSSSTRRTFLPSRQVLQLQRTL